MKEIVGKIMMIGTFIGGIWQYEINFLYDNNKYIY